MKTPLFFLRRVSVDGHAERGKEKEHPSFLSLRHLLSKQTFFHSLLFPERKCISKQEEQVFSLLPLPLRQNAITIALGSKSTPLRRLYSIKLRCVSSTPCAVGSPPATSLCSGPSPPTSPPGGSRTRSAAPRSVGRWWWTCGGAPGGRPTRGGTMGTRCRCEDSAV